MIKNTSLYIFTKLFIILFLVQGINRFVAAQESNTYPFSTNTSHLTIWNGSEYVPFFIKGINFGVAVPGTFPGELAATNNDYSKWFTQIKEAGFNCIRLYTLHYPRFFEELHAYNTLHPQNPLLFIQGVWLEEELSGYEKDLYFLSEVFKKEIEDNIDCLHGNNTIQHRFGKAYGDYSIDVSQWCLAYIIGREVSPYEIAETNTANASETNFDGFHFSIDDASASEVWITSMLDHTTQYEHINYDTQRPVSSSSWPTLDPMTHPEEQNPDEDTEFLDLAKIQIKDAPAGLFMSYHAYPYYPDFIGQQSSYQEYSDSKGPNSYIGYLEELKSHYTRFPLIIAEYGVPSSWAIGHYTSSGMNHGGFDEYNQGLTNIRMLNSIKNTDCGGGIQFAWIDEWFKRTWLFDPVDYNPESRILWHNDASAEQNFGLVSFEKTLQKDSLIKNNANADITYVNTEVNHSFFELELGLKNPLALPDEMWITFDTYSKDLGESKLPSGETIPTRSEFALHLTNYSAKLMVTEAYDIFGIWHNISEPEQLYHSIPTDGAPWEIVRIRNNYSHSDVQYIGDLQVNYDFQPPSSKDAVTIHNEKIMIRIPWSYLNVVSPDQMKVLDDDKATPEKEDIVSDGFAISILYNDAWYSSPERYSWDPWVRISNTSEMENLKTSYFVMKDNLDKFNTPAIATLDSFYFAKPSLPLSVGTSEGLLINDFDLDGDVLTSLIYENPENGQIYLNNDGSFDYYPNEGFVGYDSLKYSVYDGLTLSTPNNVIIYVDTETSNNNFTFSTISGLDLYPNPASYTINIRSENEIKLLQIFDINGKMVDSHRMERKEQSLDISSYKPGAYIVVAKTSKKILSQRFIKK